MGDQENQVGQTYWHTLVPLDLYSTWTLETLFFLLNLILIGNVYQRASIPWIKCSESLNLGHEWRGERVLAVHKTDFCAFPCSVWYNSCDFVSDFEVLTAMTAVPVSGLVPLVPGAGPCQPTSAAAAQLQGNMAAVAAAMAPSTNPLINYQGYFFFAKM